MSFAVGGAATADPAPVLPNGPVLPQSAWPPDPGFARCELQDPVTGCTDSEQWNLYGPMDGLCKAPGGVAFDQPRPDGGLPCWARNATDPDHASGVNITGAFAQGNYGRDDMLVAYIEGGVNYSSNSIKDGLDAVYLNQGELPYPQGWDGQDLGRYDYNGDGRFDIRDYAKDPRVNPKCPLATPQFVTHDEGATFACADNGTHTYLHAVNIAGPKTPYLSPEDLIAVFGHCKITDNRIANCSDGLKVDNDGNGYPNDVSGWNTYTNTNDPQNEDPGYNHASGLISEIGAESNDFGDIGVCPKCRVVPIKQGAEAVGKTDNWTPALNYAVDIGAKAVASVVVSYTYSSAGRAAVAHAIDKNVLLSFDSNDFDAMDHTDGLLYDQVFPGNSVVEDVGGKDVQSFRARSNVTSYGTHSIFSGEEESTSGSTPYQASFLALVQSAAENAVDAHVYPRSLTPNEVKQVLINTASPVITQVDHPTVPNQWPGNPDSATDATHSNWSTQYGYGRVNIGKATKLIMDGRVPPTALITSPSWYKYVDPAQTKKLNITGDVEPSAWGSQGLGWTLEWALGADPKDSDFHTLSTGTAAKSGTLGTLDTSEMAAYASKDPEGTLPPNGPEQYTVTIRLRARDGNGLKGEDRRSIGARTDPGLVKGFPKSIGTEISAAPSFVDLNGKRQLDLVYGTNDGIVSALDPDGKQVKGFPVKTRQLRYVDPANPQNFHSESYDTVQALREMRDPISGIAVGDLNGSGNQSIVAATTSGWIYAWSRTGKLVPGFPVAPDHAYDTTPVPTPMNTTNGDRSPHRGNWSAPALGDLEGNGKLDILMSSFDGHVYAYRPDGTNVPGWPVKVTLPQSIADTVPAGKLITDPKLMMTPAVGDVLGTGKDQVFLPGFQCNDATNEVWAYGIQSDGNNNAGGAYMPGWPVTLKSNAGCYDQSIYFVQEGSNSASIADFKGDGTKQITITPTGASPVIINGDGSIDKKYFGACGTPTCAGVPPYYPPDILTVGVTSQAAIGDLKGDGSPDVMQSTAGGLSLTGALGDAGQAALPHVYDQAWDSQTGDTLDNFPTDQDGFPFFNSPVVTNLTDDDTSSMIASNDSYWIHARGPDGNEAPGFPKWTGQWTSFGGVVGDPKLDKQQYLAYGSREGDLFLWKVGGKPEKNDQWWHYRHDEHNSGDYDRDTRPPAGVKLVVKKRGKKKAYVTWRAPGNNGVSNGKVAKIQVYVSRKPIKLSKLSKTKRVKSPKIAKPFGKQGVLLKAKGRKKLYVGVRTMDASGNYSTISLKTVQPPKKKHKKHHKQHHKGHKGHKRH